jgi:topoisomerase IV subunit B
MARPKSYTAESIEVLTGLDPVRKRPGMYTDTSRPNHLAQEVIDNSVDEALAGYARTIDVILYADGSLSVADDGRGMPIDIHPEEKVSGIELILTRLHAGAKFSDRHYKFSGGLHGVGVSVVNALSKRLEAKVYRDGQIFEITFGGGEKIKELEATGKCRPTDHGTVIHFWPDDRYFESNKFSIPKLKQLLRAKAVLCSGLHVSFLDENSGQKEEWLYQDGLKAYLLDAMKTYEIIPKDPLIGSFSAETEAVDWAVTWLNEGTATTTESYVNLIPTAQGGTHINGFRTGLLEALREFCDFRNLLPRQVKLAPEDVWEQCCYVLSAKIKDPQFAGQTKERLASRECVAFISGVVKDAFSIWLNQNVELGEMIAALIIRNAEKRLRASKKIERKKITSGPALPGKLADCSSQDLSRTELFLVEGDSAGGSAKQARDREFQAVMPLRGKILNTWEVDINQIFASQEVHDIAVAIGADPASANLDNLRYGKICILADADSDGLHIATLLCALFTRHFMPLVKAGHIFVAMPPLYRLDVGKEKFYALDDAEKQGILDRISSEHKRGKVSIQRFKGLGEMNPMQLRETTMNPDTRRLVQLTISDENEVCQSLDMLLAKKRASDRKAWLENEGHLADV